MNMFTAMPENRRYKRPRLQKEEREQAESACASMQPATIGERPRKNLERKTWQIQKNRYVQKGMEEL